MSNARAKARARDPRTQKNWRESEPFHVVPRHIIDNDQVKRVWGYAIMCCNRDFLSTPRDDNSRVGEAAHQIRLSRPQAYAITKLLNSDRRLRKWAERFQDPYPNEGRITKTLRP